MLRQQIRAGRARKLTAAQLAEARELIATGVPRARIARRLGVNRSTPGNPPGSPSSGSTRPPEQSTSPASRDGPNQEDKSRIEITIGNERLHGTLDGSAASRDLVAQLPVTVNMADHGSVEKTGPLPSPLSLDGQPDGADPDVGDIGYYAPGNDLVLYYGNQSYYTGIVVLGHLDGDAAERIADMDGSITATLDD